VSTRNGAAPGTSARRAGRSWQLFALGLLGALTAFGPLSLDTYLPALPQLAADLGTSATSAQATLTACLVGLAAGQLVAGPVSDRVGRMGPLLAGLAGYAASSAVCAVAPSIPVLVVLRFVQGACGAAGVVVSRAIVRDLYGGTAAARMFARLMLVNGLAPILAPVIGAQLLHLTSWRGVFAFLALVGVVLFALAATTLRETLPRERELGATDGLGPLRTRQAFGRLLRDRAFVSYAATSGLVFAAMFAYISGSSFVLEERFGLTAAQFSAVFATNAVGIVAASQVSAQLVGRLGAQVLLSAGVVGSAAGGLSLLLVVVTGAGLAGILPSLFVVVASVGLVLPNATALGLAKHPRIAGSASALLGLSQYAVGAAVAPLVGLAGRTAVWPMATVISACSLSALAVRLATLAAWRRSSRSSEPC
jgi:DHA1 family bicyclomycin/chloramphenicol resistance-like MFS transporter